MFFQEQPTSLGTRLLSSEAEVLTCWDCRSSWVDTATDHLGRSFYNLGFWGNLGIPSFTHWTYSSYFANTPWLQAEDCFPLASETVKHVKSPMLEVRYSPKPP